MREKPFVMLALSGGVDSSVCAWLLSQQAYHVEALFMKNWEETDSLGECPAEKDLRDAQAVCDQLDIKLHTVNFSNEYWNEVFEHFLQEYQAGRTPNPDVLCNRDIKFKAFLDHAIALGADFMATGHYARVEKSDSGYHLLKAMDHNKDQTYFLHLLNQKQLSKTIFPIGELTKPEVRTLAEKNHFITHDKKDSTGICFIGERKFKSFLQEYLPAQPGDIEDVDGKKIGRHEGLMYYTLGQRKGIGIGGKKNADELPWYVVKKDLIRNVLIIAQGHDHPSLFAHHLVCTQVHWILHQGIANKKYMAKIRYRQTDQTCHFTYRDPKTLDVYFDTPQRAIAPGQSIVFYENNLCLGGGIIS